MPPEDRFWIRVVIPAGEFELNTAVQLPHDPLRQYDWLPPGAEPAARERLTFRAYPFPDQDFEQLKHFTIGELAYLFGWVVWIVLLL